MRYSCWTVREERTRFERSSRMSLRADACRERAAEAKQSAAKAKNPYMKRAFEEVAHGWLLLAEQMEWMDGQEETREGEAPR
jgi:hypothetical protein